MGFNGSLAIQAYGAILSEQTLGIDRWNQSTWTHCYGAYVCEAAGYVRSRRVFPMCWTVPDASELLDTFEAACIALGLPLSGNYGDLFGASLTTTDLARNIRLRIERERAGRPTYRINVKAEDRIMLEFYVTRHLDMVELDNVKKITDGQFVADVRFPEDYSRKSSYNVLNAWFTDLTYGRTDPYAPGALLFWSPPRTEH